MLTALGRAAVRSPVLATYGRDQYTDSNSPCFKKKSKLRNHYLDTITPVKQDILCHKNCFILSFILTLTNCSLETVSLQTPLTILNSIAICHRNLKILIS